MVSFILEYKWVILVSTEVIFWITFCVFLILRYWFHSRGQFLFLYLSIVNQLLNIPLAGLDYMNTGTISLFQIVIVGLYVYAIVRGPIDMLRLDHFIDAKVLKWKKHRNFSRAITSESVELLTQYPSIMRKKFYLHSMLFVIAHLFFILNQNVSILWFAFLIIDGIWSFTFHITR